MDLLFKTEGLHPGEKAVVINLAAIESIHMNTPNGCLLDMQSGTRFVLQEYDTRALLEKLGLVEPAVVRTEPYKRPTMSASFGYHRPFGTPRDR